MNYTQYLQILAADLNEIVDPNLKNHHSLRLKVLILHLHADFVLTEIVEHIQSVKLKSSENKKLFNSRKMDFSQKLKLVYSVGNFEEGLFDTFRILNNIRNSLSHNLLFNPQSERDKINAIEIKPAIKNNILSRDLNLLEHLVFGCVGYINLLAEYFWGGLKKEKIEHCLFIPDVKNSPRIRFLVQEIRKLNLNKFKK